MNDHKITDKEALKKKYLPLVVQQLQKGALPQSIRPKLEKVGFTSAEADDLIDQAIAAADPSLGPKASAVQMPSPPIEPGAGQSEPVQVEVRSDSVPNTAVEINAIKQKLLASGFSPYEANRMAQAARSDSTRERLQKAGFGDAEIDKMIKAQSMSAGTAGIGYVPTVAASSEPNIIIYHYAGFWTRLCAMMIDGLILSIPFFLITMVCSLPVALSKDPGPDKVMLSLFGNLVGFILQWLYFAMMECGPRMGTYGKSAMNIMVLDTSGDQISFGRASARYFSKSLSLITFLVGYIMAGFTPEKRALHDYVAGTMVVKRYRYY